MSLSSPRAAPRCVDADPYPGGPVVFESGLGASGLGWQPVVDKLPPSLRAVTYARSGLGGSAATAGLRDLDELADGLVALLERTCPDGRAVLVGHSWGATVARAAAVRLPDRVAALVLVDPVPDSWILRCGRLLAPAGALLYGLLGCAARLGALTVLLRSERIARLLAGRGADLSAATRLALLAEMCRADHHRSGAREFAGMVRHSRSSLRQLTALTAPVLSGAAVVVSGGASQSRARRRLLSAHCQLAGSLRGRHVIVPSGGHFLPREQPSQLAALIASLYAGHDEADRAAHTGRVPPCAAQQAAP